MEPCRRVFISHGPVSVVLTKVERFIRGVGLEPILVKDQPSLGKAVDDLLVECMGACDTVIILATKDEQVEGRYQPRPNVLHEMGLAQGQGKHMIYLKEEGCEFPSNVSPKVWENFTQDNMEEAYLKLVKELKGFGVLR